MVLYIKEKQVSNQEHDVYTSSVVKRERYEIPLFETRLFKNGKERESAAYIKTHSK